jgi:tetraacyldisaccharide 4'-kinase
MKNRNALFVYGRPFAPFYSALMRMREYLYRTGVLKVNGVSVPVVSVGNLTLGGTGKTPVVQYLAGMLRDRGFTPAVISRGYGGSAREKVNIVSRGGEPLLPAALAGDEPRLLAETLPGTPVLTGAARKYPAARAVEMGADVLILDDGFQHLALARNLDLVLFNADTLAGNSRVFPGGDLREPVKALNRCHGFVMTGVNEGNRERAERFGELLRERFPGRPVFLARYEAAGIVRQRPGGGEDILPVAMAKNIAFYGFSGIAHPERFRQAMTGLGIEARGFRIFRDHYPYAANDMESLGRLAEEAGAGALITTEKDMVKLQGLQASLPVYTLRMQVFFDEPFHEFVLERLAAARRQDRSGTA